LLKRYRLIALLLSATFLSAGVMPAIAASSKSAIVAGASAVVAAENGSRNENSNEHGSRHEDQADAFESSEPEQVSRQSKDSIALPPVVIKPNNSNQKMAPANLPVELGSLQPAKKTPADVFVESATVGVGAMALGAAALGAVAITRGARARREKNAEYLYSSDN